MSAELSRRGRPFEAAFERERVQPAAALYVAAENAIWITAFGSVTGITLEVRGQLLRADGVVVPFVFEASASSDRTGTTTVRHIGEGYLLHLSIFRSAGTIRRGQCFVQCGLARGVVAASRTDEVLLAQGYIGLNNGLTWPGSPTEPAVSGAGILRLISGTDPAAGVEVTETVPTGARWRLLSIRVALVTSGVGAARSVNLALDDGTTIFLRVPHTTTQAISLTRTYIFGDGLPAVADTDTLKLSALARGIMLFAGWRIRTLTTDLDGADNFGAPVIVAEEWLEP